MQKGYHGRYQIAVLNCTGNSRSITKRKSNANRKVQRKHGVKSKAMFASLEGTGGFWVK
jgi:hypothetical protein